jgi:hypothetical protein
VSERVAASVAEVAASWERLAADRALVLEPRTRALWMAMPFSAIPTDFRVRTGPIEAYANCAWDALGIPALLGRDGAIETTDPISGDRLAVSVQDGRLTRTDLVVHVAVPAAAWWEDIGFT